MGIFMTKNIGLSGCSGAGKTLLAQTFEHGHRGEIGYCPSVAGAMFKRYGYSQSSQIMPEERIYLQERILDAQIDEYERCLAVYGGFISDRTPVDMATFTMLNTDAPNFRHAKAYAGRCIAVTKKFFPKVLVIPSLLPYDDDGSRPPYSKEGLEKYHGKLLGLLQEGEIPYETMPEVIDLQERVAWLSGVYYDAPRHGASSDGKET